MNKTFLRFATLMFTFLTLAFSVTSCDKPDEDPVDPENPENPENPEKPAECVFQLNETTVEMTAEGGKAKVTYTLENPVEGQTIAIEENADWISDFNTDTANEINFIVSANKTFDTRKAEIKVTYNQIEQHFNVSQAASQSSGDPSFELSVSDVTKRFATINVLPKDKKMDYITFIIPKDTLDLYPSTDAEIFSFDMNRFKAASELYEMELTDFLLQMSSSGDIMNSRLQGLMPSIDYYLYAYGLDIFTQERLTEVCKVEFRTKDVNMIEAEFDIKTSVDQYTASVQVTPKNYSGWCYADSFTGIPEDATYDEIFEAVQANWAHIIGLYDSFGVSPEDMCQEVAFKEKYDKTSELKANTLYYVIAFALDDEGLLCSNITYQSFHTEEATMSENVITIDISEIGSTTAVANFRTTNDDPYVQIARPKREFQGFGSDEEIMDYLLKTWYMETKHGDYERHLEMMEPDTEYLAVAFGYAGYTYNTELFKKGFKTLPAGKATEAPSEMCRLDVRRYAIEENDYFNERGTKLMVPFFVK